MYRNNGLPFQEQDWARLRKIAEGNPDVSKVGAFGVGAYTMFSICENPLVLSGGQALAFLWKGDALWTKTAPSPHPTDEWTSFVLPSRDPYPIPDLVQFGQFLCSSLTFTQSLNTVHVSIDGTTRLTITKNQVQMPTAVSPPKASSWWSNDGTRTKSPQGIFSLNRAEGTITESVIEMRVELDRDTSSVRARYVSAVADARVPHEMARKMERVTKKKPPKTVHVHVFIDAGAKRNIKRRSKADAIIDAFSPRMGCGSVFIGFKTSQTTGLAAHLAAPLIPTVEREAIDFQDPTLRIYNHELLAIAGIIMRLTLEHSMGLVGIEWENNKSERLAYEEKLKKESSSVVDDVYGEQSSSIEQNGNIATGTELKKPQERGGIFGFAKFMSSGVKKIADVIASVDFMGAAEDDFLNPKDPRPLSKEENDAIMLMRSFCPQQSTPDPQVGTVIASGFISCMPKLTPPVLSKTGVVRSAECRLPYRGIEAFVTKNVVRKLVLQNAEDYLRHVASCRNLNVQDLEQTIGEKPLLEDEVVQLLKWWRKYTRLDPEVISHGPAIKQAIQLLRSETVIKEEQEKESNIIPLNTIEYFIDDDLFSKDLPMPNTVFPTSIGEKLPRQLLSEKCFANMFSPLPFYEWASFIVKHPVMTEGRKIDSNVRLLVLTTFHKKYSKCLLEERRAFGEWLHRSLAYVRCIPFEVHIRSSVVTDFPSDLYLHSAELGIFQGLGSFRKVSPLLHSSGISDEFLMTVGVRKTIAIDFLFTQLDNLKWNRDPKPLVTYLRTASLTKKDILKLTNTKYLPEVNDKNRTYAPSELLLPNPEVKIFPFLKVLQWPSQDDLSEKSLDGAFLIKLGCHINPPLGEIMNYMVMKVEDKALRVKCLEFVCKRLGPGGPYVKEYEGSRSILSGAPSPFLNTKFLPAIRDDPLDTNQPQEELHAPRGCYSCPDSLCMGFPILDPKLEKGNLALFGDMFGCNPHPSPDLLVYQLLNVVSSAKKKFTSTSTHQDEYCNHVIYVFKEMFKYMSTRTDYLDKQMMNTLKEAEFIPCRSGATIKWFQVGGIYFKNGNNDSAELTELLFHVIEFSPFLAAVGVKSEPSADDLFRLLISYPKLVMEKLGSELKYRNLLRRMAASASYSKVTKEMKTSAFLIGYHLEEGEGSKNAGEDDSVGIVGKYELAKAKDISIIDNSFFARMFNVLTAPQESDLERFYVRLGSEYLSKQVRQQFEVVRPTIGTTALTDGFTKRIRERIPLLVSSNITTRPLVSGAAGLLSEENLHVCEVERIKAVYTLGKSVKLQEVSCCTKPRGRNKYSLFITEHFDWFDVGKAVGDLILQRCRLQDAFFLSSLLEAPLRQLRARGFPVDRMLSEARPVSLPAELVTDEIQPDYDHGAKPKAASSNQIETHKEEKNQSKSVSNAKEKSGFENILKQMFPDCNLSHIQKLLGSAPTLDTLRRVSNILANGNYPTEQPTSSNMGNAPGERPPPPESIPKNAQPPNEPNQYASNTNRPTPKQGNSPSILSRAFRGLRASAMSGGNAISPTLKPGSSSGGGTMQGPSDENTPVPPKQDVTYQRNLEGRLKNSINRSSKAVSSSGLSFPETVMSVIPEGFTRNGTGCEIIPGHDLKPFKGPHATGRTKNGVLVFASRREGNSEALLEKNFIAVECFSEVLEVLCKVYSLKISALAIFYEPTGRTIAFNSGGALQFNFRMFWALHYTPHSLPDATCYSYWFTTMAHELAHNQVSAHNKEHGYYTESYVSTFLPNLLGTIPRP